jgi:CDP-diacylglycerol--glycerol-3-phosphate 3-phosphatidyltransferase
MASALDLYLGVIPTAAATCALVSGLLYFAVMDRLGRIKGKDEPFFYRFYHWFVRPAVRLLGDAGVTPNAITAASLLLAGLSAVAIGAQHFMIATWLLVTALTCDVLDGEVARGYNRSTPSGAFFDSVADRIAEGIMFGGIAYWGQGALLTWVSIATLIASFAVSYARARSQSLGVDAKVGLMERPARVAATAFSLFLGALGQWLPFESAPAIAYAATTGLLSVVCALTIITAVQRVHHAITRLDSGAPKDDAPAIRAA